MNVDFSLGEFQALALKALRGAGYSWGQAEDGARAARALAAADLPAGAALCALLDAAPTAGECPVCQGCALSDDPERAAGASISVVAPILLLPALTALGVEMKGRDLVGRAGADGLSYHGPVDTALRRVSLAPLADRITGGTASRAVLSQTQLDQLQSFAHRTYAPATEESRLKGAG